MIPYDWLHIELMQIELFLRCAENQNFTKAAISMRVTPGMVSKRIGALESALGVTLFTREKNRVHLTEAGNNLYADLTRITEEFVQAAERVRIKEKEQDRPILFGLCDATNIDRYFLPLMYSFESEGDEPAFRIRLQKSFDMLDEISSGRIDIGFAPMFMEEAVQLHRDLSCFLALPSPLFACLSENSPLAGRETVDTGTLSGERLLFPPSRYSPDLTQAMLEALGNPGQVEYSTDSTDFRIRVISEGMVGIMPWSSRTIQNEYLKGLPVSDVADGFDLVLLWRKDRQNKALQTVARTLAGGYQN